TLAVSLASRNASTNAVITPSFNLSNRIDFQVDHISAGHASRPSAKTYGPRNEGSMMNRRKLVTKSICSVRTYMGERTSPVAVDNVPGPLVGKYLTNCATSDCCSPACPCCVSRLVNALAPETFPSFTLALKAIIIDSREGLIPIASNRIINNIPLANQKCRDPGRKKFALHPASTNVSCARRMIVLGCNERNATFHGISR